MATQPTTALNRNKIRALEVTYVSCRSSRRPSGPPALDLLHPAASMTPWSDSYKWMGVGVGGLAEGGLVEKKARERQV
jgi:hypothetical protein